MQITINKLSFHYDNPYQEIFKDFSLTISSDWKTALIGRNGRGKTTFFRLLTGDVKPISGSITVPMGTMYFPNITADDNTVTQTVIRESIAPFSFWESSMNNLLIKGDDESLKTYSEYMDKFLHYDGYTIDSIIEKEAEKIGLNIDILNRPFNTLSGGERTRALILSVFLRKDTFPLLDEPTDHLDLKGRELLAEYLAGNKKGFIVASHDRYLLDSCADHVISINKSDVSVMQGNYSTWKYQWDTEQEFEQRRSENLQREINDLEKAAQQRRKWSDSKEKEKRGAADKGYIGHKAAKMMKRAVSIEKRMEENINDKKELLKNKEITTPLIMKSSGKSPERILAVNGMSVSINERTIFSNIYLNVNKGDRIAVTGENGCGKTTLLNAVCGTIPFSSGDLYLAPNIKIARAYQYPLWYEGYLKDHLYNDKIDMTSFRFIMAAFGIRGDIFDHPLESFSKGQLRKVDLCRTIVSSPQLLIWDEPLNYLDIESREQLEEFILKEELTIIFVEHDKVFVERTATEVIVMKKTSKQ